MRIFSRNLRTLAGIALFFFAWSYLPLYSCVAYAATAQKQEKNGKGPGSRGRGPGSAPAQTTAETFEKALEGMRATVSKAGERAAKNQDVTTEVAEIKAKRAEIESIDKDLRAQFAATEKKLKDANLPKVILDRHYAFVKHYDQNLTQLKSELDDIANAKTASEREAKLETARLHLEKTKAPSRHQKLDPNNLPFRARKAMAPKAPRLKKEDFEKDFPKKRKTNLAADERGWTRILNSALEQNPSRSTPDRGIRGQAPHVSPILLAYNDISSNVPFTLGIDSIPQSAIPQFAFSDSTLNSERSTLNLALASADAPTADDLAETPDIQFTDAIRAKAQELGGNPVQIYNWVRNNIEYAPTYGSIQGADQCLQSKICNDMDTASLLIALFRVSGIYAHYVYGSVDIPSDKAMNWVGGVTDPKMAGTIFATNGVPVTALISGGTIKYDRIEHVWVNAYVDMIPSRGAVHKQGDTWIPLDASYKQYNYTQGIDMSSAVPFDAQTFANQILSTATTNTIDGSVTNVNSTYVQQTITGYQTQVQNYIQQNYPNATVGDVIGSKRIIQQNNPIFAGTLPYKTVTSGWTAPELPDSLRHKLNITLLNEDGLSTIFSITKSMPEIAGKKITLSYIPATSSDETTLLSYANSTMSSFPAYLISLTPELRIDGQLVASGRSVGMAKSLPFNLTFNSPGSVPLLISNFNTVGTYTAVVLDLGVTVSKQLDTLATKINMTRTKLDSNDLSGITKDDIMGDFLYGIGLGYWGLVDFSNQIASQVNGVVHMRLPSEGLFTYGLNAEYIFGVPTSATPSGFTTDIDANQHVVASKTGNTSQELAFMTASGMMASRMEASIYDLTFNKAYTGKGISTAHIFEYANQQGIPIYSIDSGNIATVLPNLALPSAVIADIQNAVNAGKIVTVPKTTITKDGWTGAGYLILDKITGAGSYQIGGGLSGGGYTCNCFGLSPTVEFLVGISLAGLALALPAIAAALAIIFSGVSLASLICNINHVPNLTQDQRDILIYAAWTMFFIGVAVAALSVFVFSVPFLVASLGWIIYSIVTSWAILSIANIVSNLNNQQQN